MEGKMLILSSSGIREAKPDDRVVKGFHFRDGKLRIISGKLGNPEDREEEEDAQPPTKTRIDRVTDTNDSVAQEPSLASRKPQDTITKTSTAGDYVSTTIPGASSSYTGKKQPSNAFSFSADQKPEAPITLTVAAEKDTPKPDEIEEGYRTKYEKEVAASNSALKRIREDDARINAERAIAEASRIPKEDLGEKKQDVSPKPSFKEHLVRARSALEQLHGRIRQRWSASPPAAVEPIPPSPTQLSVEVPHSPDQATFQATVPPAPAETPPTDSADSNLGIVADAVNNALKPEEGGIAGIPIDRRAGDIDSSHLEHSTFTPPDVSAPFTEQTVEDALRENQGYPVEGLAATAATGKPATGESPGITTETTSHSTAGSGGKTESFEQIIERYQGLADPLRKLQEAVAVLNATDPNDGVSRSLTDIKVADAANHLADEIYSNRIGPDANLLETLRAQLSEENFRIFEQTMQEMLKDNDPSAKNVRIKWKKYFREKAAEFKLPAWLFLEEPEEQNPTETPVAMTSDQIHPVAQPELPPLPPARDEDASHQPPPAASGILQEPGSRFNEALPPIDTSAPAELPTTDTQVNSTISPISPGEEAAKEPLVAEAAAPAPQDATKMRPAIEKKAAQKPPEQQPILNIEPELNERLTTIKTLPDDYEKLKALATLTAEIYRDGDPKGDYLIFANEIHRTAKATQTALVASGEPEEAVIGKKRAYVEIELAKAQHPDSIDAQIAQLEQRRAEQIALMDEKGLNPEFFDVTISNYLEVIKPPSAQQPETVPQPSAVDEEPLSSPPSATSRVEPTEQGERPQETTLVSPDSSPPKAKEVLEDLRAQLKDTLPPVNTAAPVEPPAFIQNRPPLPNVAKATPEEIDAEYRVLRKEELGHQREALATIQEENAKLQRQLEAERAEEAVRQAQKIPTTDLRETAETTTATSLVQESPLPQPMGAQEIISQILSYPSASLKEHLEEGSSERIKLEKQIKNLPQDKQQQVRELLEKVLSSTTSNPTLMQGLESTAFANFPTPAPPISNNNESALTPPEEEKPSFFQRLFGGGGKKIKQPKPPAPGIPGKTFTRRRFVAGLGAVALTATGAGVLDTALGAQQVAASDFSDPDLFKPKATKTPTAQPSASPSPVSTTAPTFEATTAVSTATTTATPSPTATPGEKPSPAAKANASPTASVESANMEKVEATATATTESSKEAETIGNKNILEFLLGDLPEQFIKKRLERLEADTKFADAMFGDAQNETEKQKMMEIINSGRINFAILVIDETRQRPNEYSGVGIGRADTIITVSFDPKTFKTVVVSTPRDLYSPRAHEYFDSQDAPAKINHLTLIPWTKKGLNENERKKEVERNDEEVVRNELEVMTGLPIDTMLKVNIDAVLGYFDESKGQRRPGIVDSLFPEGLEIDVPEDLYDPAFPTDNYGSKILHFKKGRQRMTGQQAVEYARTRVDSAANRDRRQRQVSIEVAKNLIPRLMEDLKQGKNDTIKEAVNIIKWHKENGNLFDIGDMNFIKFMEIIGERTDKLMKNPTALGKLLANTAPVVASLVTQRSNIAQIGFSRENILVNVANNEGLKNAYAMIKPKGTTVNSGRKKSPAGNYLKYHQETRKMVREQWFAQAA